MLIAVVYIIQQSIIRSEKVYKSMFLRVNIFANDMKQVKDHFELQQTTKDAKLN
jgi:hypothetical protein